VTDLLLGLALALALLAFVYWQIRNGVRRRRR
jgi:hypothetical protein